MAPMTAADALPDPPWWTPRKSAAPRRSLNREVVVAAALGVLRAEGIDALSMRRVATELGTGAASLYAHIAHKEELLDLVLDEVLGEIDVPEADGARWREQITAFWTSFHAALVRNGDIARVLLGRVPMGPNSLRVAEGTMAILRAGGVPDQAVAWAVDIVGRYVAATAIESAEHVNLQRSGGDPGQYYARVFQYFAGLPADRFPVTAALVPVLTQGDGDVRFAFGLDLIVRGLAGHAEEARARGG